MDEQRDRAKLCDRAVEQALPAVAFGKVGGEEVDAVFGGRSDNVATQHRGAFFLQCLGDAAADAAGATRDQGAFALQKLRAHAKRFLPSLGSEPMDRTRPTLNQLNIVSGNPAASIDFYRRLRLHNPAPQ